MWPMLDSTTKLGAEVALDRPRLCGRLDDHEALSCSSARRVTRSEAQMSNAAARCRRPSPLYTPDRRTSPLPVLTARLPAPSARARRSARSGGFVLAANHVSNFDPWPLGLPLLPKRCLRFMAKSELYWWPLAAVLNGAGAFKVRRGAERRRGDRDRRRARARRARSSRCSPRARGRERAAQETEARPRTGAARIAHEAGAPLVPAAIKGTDRLSRLGKLRVAYGEPSLDDSAEREDAPGRDRAPDARDRCSSTRRYERPLLVVDGDSFAHRAYHALPKSIRPATPSSASRT